jgi:enamine deaminase RidA (YjgF/YER057c/UK114 family)
MQVRYQERTAQMSAVEDRLAALQLRLPEPVQPQFEYVPVVVVGEVAYVSGQVPRLDAQSVVAGKLGAELDVERGREAARLCVLHALAALLGEVFGDRGRHARSAIGVAELPRGSAVEVEMIVALRPGPR